MILSEIQQFIAENKRASIADLKLHFRTDGDALRPMLDWLIRKGRISKMPEAKKCSGCCSCGNDATEIYVWVNADQATPVTESVSLNCH
jgi:putative ferrous iron transport protein C